MVNKKYVFDQDLRGHDYVREIVKDRHHHCKCKDCAMREREPDVVQLVNNWQVADELRFVGSI